MVSQPFLIVYTQWKRLKKKARIPQLFELFESIQIYLTICTSLLFRHKKMQFLYQIVIDDEK